MNEGTTLFMPYLLLVMICMMKLAFVRNADLMMMVP
ncbi:hypothetical protein BAMA111019_05025 [Bacillus manliponensis]